MRYLGLGVNSHIIDVLIVVLFSQNDVVTCLNAKLYCCCCLRMISVNR